MKMKILTFKNIRTKQIVKNIVQFLHRKIYLYITNIYLNKMVLTPKYVIHLKFNCTSPTNKEISFRIKCKSRLKKKIISCIPEVSLVLEESLSDML